MAAVLLRGFPAIPVNRSAFEIATALFNEHTIKAVIST